MRCCRNEQVMAPIDYEMAQLVPENMVSNNIQLILGDGVSKFESKQRNNHNIIKRQNLINRYGYLSIGVRPNGQLAKMQVLKLIKRRNNRR